MNRTYEHSLSILFLDRLGNPKDRALIETLAVRLIAGQTVTGGWHYSCPIVSTADQKKLIMIRKQLEPPKLFNPLEGPVAQLNPLGKGQEPPGLGNPVAGGSTAAPNPLPGGSSNSPNPLPTGGATSPPAVGLIPEKLEPGPDADAPRPPGQSWSKRWNWCIKAQE